MVPTHIFNKRYFIYFEERLSEDCTIHKTNDRTILLSANPDHFKHVVIHVLVHIIIIS